MTKRQQQISWCVIGLCVLVCAWLFWKYGLYYWSIVSVERAGGTVQVLTNAENYGKLAVAFPEEISDAELENMTALDRLRPVWLQVHGRQVSGRGLASLKRLDCLRGLGLNATSVTDDDLRSLKAFPELATLNLESNAISSNGLDHLKTLPNLKCVSLRHTLLTPDDIRRLQAARPDLLVLSEFLDVDD